MRPYLNERGIKQSWVASKVGISQPYLCLILSGNRNLPDTVAARLVELFGADPAFREAILGGER